MITELVESIAIALDGEFGEGYTIYDESIEQGMTEPCFFVQCLDSTFRLYRGKRYYRTQQLCIQYFPVDKGNARKECEWVTERLYTALECLTVHDNDDQFQLWGRDMRHEIRDNVLNFFINYNVFILMEAENPLMEKLDQHMREKKGVMPNG